MRKTGYLLKTNGKGKRYERCHICGNQWNVSRHMDLPKGGYVCPVCRNKKAPGTAIPKGQIKITT